LLRYRHHPVAGWIAAPLKRSAAPSGKAWEDAQRHFRNAAELIIAGTLFPKV